MTVNPPAVICASSVKVAMPDTTIPVEFVSNFAALTSPVKSPMKVVAVTLLDANKLEPVMIPVDWNELAVTIPVKFPCPVESIPTP